MNADMYLHLGGDVAIPIKDIISIIDMSSKEKSKVLQEFLKTSEEEGFIKRISNDEPKSFILAEINKKTKVFLSPISSITLLKRTNFINDISNT